jgi:hypothetical protein
MARPLLISIVSPNFNLSGGASWLGVSAMCAWCGALRRECLHVVQEDGRRMARGRLPWSIDGFGEVGGEPEHEEDCRGAATRGTVTGAARRMKVGT